MFETWAVSKEGFYTSLRYRYRIDINKLITLATRSLITQKVRIERIKECQYFFFLPYILEKFSLVELAPAPLEQLDGECWVAEITDTNRHFVLRSVSLPRTP